MAESSNAGLWVDCSTTVLLLLLALKTVTPILTNTNQFWRVELLLSCSHTFWPGFGHRWKPITLFPVPGLLLSVYIYNDVKLKVGHSEVKGWREVHVLIPIKNMMWYLKMSLYWFTFTNGCSSTIPASWLFLTQASILLFFSSFHCWELLLGEGTRTIWCRC